jgi:transcriptional regulator with GAF, ATPase, and Fis domain
MSAADAQTPAQQPPWLIAVAHDPASTVDAVATLGSFMRVAEAGRAPAGDEPGAIVFDRVDDALLALAHETSRAGRRRVLGIATGAEPPAGADCWRLLREGMADVVVWDGPAAVRSRIDRWQGVDELVASPLVAEHLVGASPAWRSVLRDVVEIAHFSDVDVLITGESGTGKELTAQLIHTLDQRPRKGELVVVDCTTIVPSLSGSEFFGHERGAFTGAVAARDGAFALADGGTLFLDEVGELPLALQAELLRAVQEGTYKRVGSNRWQRARFRLVCATNRDLLASCDEGAFRADLFFRLAAASIEMPPLRRRPDDILTLAEHFLAEGEAAAPPLSQAVRDLLQARDYPGNVRDLKQLMSRIGLRHVGPGPVTAGDVPPSERPLPGTAPGWQDELATALRRAVALGVPLREIVDAARDTAISVAVTSADGSLRHAATRLGVTDRTLQMHRARRRDGRAA